MYKHPYFSNSIRIFFPLACIIAIMVPMWTTSILNNDYPFSHAYFNANQWHGYEMLFGFLLTLLTGFIFTAGGYWSGKGPISGKPLAILLMSWVVDHVSIYVQTPSVIFVISLLVFPIYFLYLLEKLLDGYAQKIKFMILFFILFILKTAYIVGGAFINKMDYTLIQNLSIWLFTYFVFLISTRVTPRFTQTFFKFENKIKTPQALLIASELSVISLFATAFDFMPTALSGVMYMAASLLILIQISHWRIGTAIKKPIIGFLHIGYIFFALSLLTIGLGKFIPSFGILKSDLHLLFTGGMAFIAINIMVRSSLGHSGRKIEMTPTIYGIFICILGGSLLRFFLPVFWPNYAIKSLHHSMGFWTLGYIIFLMKFIPFLVRKRVDGK